MGQSVQEKVKGLLSWRSVASYRIVVRDLATFRAGAEALDMVVNEQPAFEEMALQQWHAIATFESHDTVSDLSVFIGLNRSNVNASVSWLMLHDVELISEGLDGGANILL